MGLFGFGRKRKDDDSPPPGLNERHGYESPIGNDQYIDAAPNFASRVGRELPRIPYQDALLLPSDRPPADQPPGEWYRGYGGKEWSDWTRSQQEEHVLAAAQGYPFQPERVNWTGNPNFSPPAPSRIMRAPSMYSFTRDMGAQSARHLTGYHASMASIQKTYQPLGMTPAYKNRNTYRVDPPPRDAYITDVPQGQDARVVDSVYVSPNPSSAPTGLNRSFRLT